MSEIDAVDIKTDEVSCDDGGNYNPETETETQEMKSAKKTVFSCDDRLVIADDAFHYLSTITTYGKGVSVFTSMPDITELPTMFHGYLVKDYKAWFTNAAFEVLSRLDIGSHAIFLQSDVRMMNSKGNTFEWIDKSHLIATAADKTHCTMVWHKMVLTSKTLEKRSTGRPCYSHLVCFVKNPPTPPPSPPMSPSHDSHYRDDIVNSEHNQGQSMSKSKMKAKRRAASRKKQAVSEPTESDGDGEEVTAGEEPIVAMNVMDQASAHMFTHRTSQFSIPDIFYRGEMLWARGIGLDCSYVAVMFLREIAKCHTIIDPFVGQGTVLAMANALGLKAIGIEISRKRCRKAFACRISEQDLALISPALRNIEADVLEERRRLKEQKDLQLQSAQNVDIYGGKAEKPEKDN